MESSPLLEDILSTEGEDVLVRHESAEALGAIGSSSFLPVLEKFSNHDAPEIAETCRIAVDLIHYKMQYEQQHTVQHENATGDQSLQSSLSISPIPPPSIKSSIYASVDPAPPISENKSISEIRSCYLDQSLSLFERYRAMFSLRDLNSDESVSVLVEGKSSLH